MYSSGPLSPSEAHTLDARTRKTRTYVRPVPRPQKFCFKLMVGCLLLVLSSPYATVAFLTNSNTVKEMEDSKPAARESVLIDLSQEDVAAPRAPSNAATATIDLTRDASWINLVSPESNRKRRSSSEFNNDRKRKKRKTSVDCSICLDTVDAFQGYQLQLCGHEYCRSCLHGYIQSKLSSKEVSTLYCPDTKCKCKLNSNDVRACTLELGDATSWRSFQEVATERFLDASTAPSNDESTSFRRCPTNHCNFCFQYESTGNPQQGQLFICPLCTEAYCLECPVVKGKVGPAHDDTCFNVLEEIRKSKERQRLLEEWKRDKCSSRPAL